MDALFAKFNEILDMLQAFVAKIFEAIENIGNAVK